MKKQEPKPKEYPIRKLFKWAENGKQGKGRKGLGVNW